MNQEADTMELSATIETAAPATADPELGEWRCPHGHDSSIPPRLPELSFEACGIKAPKAERIMVLDDEEEIRDPAAACYRKLSLKFAG